MTTFEAVFAFAAVAGLLTLVPGLDTALVLRSSLTHSSRYAWAAAAGIASGAMAWGMASAIGVSAVLTASELGYRLLTAAGAVYMCFLGASMIWKSARGKTVQLPSAAAIEVPDVSPWRGWLVGAGTNLLNPKVGVFYIATIPQFLPPDSSPLPMGATLAGVHGLLTLAWFGLLISAGSFARSLLANPRTLTAIDRVTGLVLIGFGGRLLSDALLTDQAVTPSAHARLRLA